MILTDREIRARLADFGFAAPVGATPFDPDVQIKSCSVDLRLSPTIWKPRRWRTLDLSLKNPWGAKIAQAFEQQSIPESGYVLRPGQFVLGRTFETFSIPSDLAGRLTGRSSIGRLGISVVAPSSVINPGWSGHMPLMIINHAPFSIRLYSGLSVVQAYFSKLSEPPAKLYGDDPDAKYQNDDGGPSKYWLDWSMKLLKSSVDAKTAGQAQTDHLARVSAALDEPTRRRFAKALAVYGTVSDTGDFIEFFARRERTRSAALMLMPALLSLPIAVLFRWGVTWWNDPSQWPKIVVLALAGATAFIAWRLFKLNEKTAFTANDIRRIAREQEHRPEG